MSSPAEKTAGTTAQPVDSVLPSPSSSTPELSKEANGDVVAVSSDNEDAASSIASRTTVPLSWKLMSVIMISLIGFGSAWSNGLTSAMKSTIKKELKINNTQFALLEASEDFMVTALMMVSGIVTDRIGGAGAMLYGNLIFTAGTMIVAGAATGRSYKLMIAGRVITALGDIATQVAQYKVFSSWFPPSAGFATTLGLELGIGRIGGFVGTTTANIISKRTGNFAWVYWVAVCINVFTNITTLGFWFFTKVANKRFYSSPDPATGERLTEKNKKFELRKVLELPWVFWAVMMFSIVETSCAIVFTQNATELAEQRFGTDSVSAGWYSGLAQYAGFFITPILGFFLDMYGNRLSAMFVCGTGVFISMALVNWASTTAGTAASFAFFAIFKTLGPTTIIDSIRTSMWHQSVFGSAYAVKITLNNAMNIIVRVVCGVIQDRDNNSYDRVTIVYVFLAAASIVTSLAMLLAALRAQDLRILQYTRKQRIAHGAFINERKARFHGDNGPRNRRISRICFMGLIFLVLGAWSGYFWGVATGNNG